MSLLRKLTILALAAGALCAGSARANLVTNGGFETGDLTGWSGGGCLTSVRSAFDGFTPVGNYALYGGCVGGLAGVSQTLATTPGASYVFSFLYGSDGALPNQFIALWDGAAVFSTLNDTTDTRPGYLPETVNVVASGSQTTISFQMRNVPAYQSLDNVSVTPSAVPEPASLALVGVALAGLGLASRKRRAA
ncbi:MAG: PEP-CTERM sorting domain-containing protein [Burkholderiales bacterium]|nr:PEP-CTERM sorting domain-containing protein [Burkholderiales bacterium]